LSTSESISQIRELRGEVLRVNADIRLLSNIAVDGKLALRDYLTLVRLLTGGSPELTSLIASMQTTIAVVQTARTVTKLLQIEMGPIGWLLLGASAFVGFVATEQMMRRPQY
jgi:uncharacterized protein YaaW (UPF0174 family)